jgi:hypothetical protein
MAVSSGTDPGDPGLWASRGDGLRVSGVRIKRAGLSSVVISGLPRMCPAPERFFPMLLLGISQLKFLSLDLNL